MDEQTLKIILDFLGSAGDRAMPIVILLICRPLIMWLIIGGCSIAIIMLIITATRRITATIYGAETLKIIGHITGSYLGNYPDSSDAVEIAASVRKLKDNQKEK